MLEIRSSDAVMGLVPIGPGLGGNDTERQIVTEDDDMTLSDTGTKTATANDRRDGFTKRRTFGFEHFNAI